MQITVFGLVYEIEYSDSMLSDDWGVAQHTQQIIKINKNLKPEHQKVTLMHELIHAILTATIRSESHEDLEGMIRCISLGLCQIGYDLDLKTNIDK